MQNDQQPQVPNSQSGQPTYNPTTEQHQPQQIQPQYNPVGPQPLPDYQPPGAKKPLGKILGVFLAIALLIGGGTGYYLLMYLPNTPENVYRRGMASIGVGLEELIEKNMLPSSEATEFTGEFTMTSPMGISANLEGSAALGGDGRLAINAAWDEYNPELELLYFILTPEFPQVYFRFDGIQEVVDGNFGPRSFEQITSGEQYENIWWLVDYRELVDQGLLTESELEEILSSNDPGSTLTTEDTIALTQAFIDASNTYIFTAETENMVLERTTDLGEEEFEGVLSNKYGVSVNTENFKKYLKAIRDNVLATGALEKINPEYDFSQEFTDEEIDKWVDGLDFSEVNIEAWVSKDSKILRNIRVMPTDQENGTSSVDVSLLLNDTNLSRIPLRVKLIGDDDESEGQVTLDWVTDVNANTTEMTVDTNIQYKNNPEGNVVFTTKFKTKGLSAAPLYEVPSSSQSLLDKLFEGYESVEQVLGATIQKI